MDSNLIFDRTQQDVIDDTLKGQYNASDLNRVEGWCEYLKNELNAVGYSISFTTKTNWTQSDMRTAAEMERIRSNIKKLMNGYYYVRSIYATAENFDWKKANNWEQILNDIFRLMNGMKNYYVYSGVSNSGQRRLWQNRFRHFYTPVTYIASNGTQYIDTGFKHNQDTRFVADMEFSNVKSYTYPFGSFGGAQANQLLFVGELDNNTPHKIGTYYKTKYSFSSILAEGRHIFDLNKNVHTVDSTSHTYTYTNFASTYNDLIFGAATYDGSLRTTATVIKLYSFKIYDNGTLVRDYIPVLDYNGTPCLYDQVEHKFYYNAGTGSFLFE